MPPKVLLFGSGAIGTIYVYLLLKAGCDVTVVCRSNYDAVKADGFHIDSDLYGQGIHIHPRVTRTPSEAASSGPYDYLIVTSKALPDAKTAETIAPAVTKGHTTIVLIQNGIAIEEEYARIFPDNALLSCTVYLPTTQVKPGFIQMGGIEQLEVGTHPPGSGAITTAEELISILNSAGGNAKFYPDIQEKRWFKLLLNAPWNPICALTLSRDVAYLASSDLASEVVQGVMGEVIAIAKALDYTSITREAAESQLHRAKDRVGTKGIEPSMLVDVLWSRRMEVEVILGNPVRKAKELGVDVPRMEMLYALTKALDASIAYRREGESLSGLDVQSKA